MNNIERMDEIARKIRSRRPWLVLRGIWDAFRYVWRG